MKAREYVIGVPAVVTVHDDGRVSVWVDLADSPVEILDVWPNDEPPEGDIQRVDSQRVAAAITGRTITIEGVSL